MHLFRWAVLMPVFALGAAAATPPFTSFDVTGSDFINSDSVGGISNSGMIVGYYGTASGALHGFQRLPNGTFVQPIDGPDLLLGFPRDFLTGINNSGTMTASGSNPVKAYTVSGGVFTQFLVPGSLNVRLGGINDLGHLAGWFDTGARAGRPLAFTTAGGTLQFFEYPGSFDTLAYGINNSDQVVGYYDVVGGPGVLSHGFIRSVAGTFSTVDFPGAALTGLNGINDSGIVVGAYSRNSAGFFSDFHCFYGTPGALTELFIGSGCTGAGGINNAGQISGTYLDARGITHGFVTQALFLPPTPAPSSLALLAVALGFVGIVSALRGILNRPGGL